MEFAKNTNAPLEGGGKYSSTPRQNIEDQSPVGSDGSSEKGVEICAEVRSAQNKSQTLTTPPTKHLMQRPLPSRAQRKIPKRSSHHFVGQLVYNRGEQRQCLGFASLLEYHTALCFIYRPDFLDIEEQLAALPFILPNGKKSAHFFDFKVTFRGGWRVCISVKPERIAQTFAYRATMDCIKRAAIGNICEDVRTVTQRNIHPIELHNAKLFHSARDPEPQIDALISERLKSLPNPMPIRDFLAREGLQGTGFRATARAIRFGKAKLLNREKITDRTLITRGSFS